MDSMDKLWQKVDKLDEERIRQSEKIAVVERQNQQMLSHMSKMEGNMQAGIEALGAKFDEYFSTVHSRIDELEGQKREQAGYKKAQAETRASMMKQFALWISIVGLGASFLFWILTRGAS